MILLIDNYDSFSYNLFQLIGSIEPNIKVVRNDEITVEQLEKLDISHLIISPGPGRPEDAGICIQAIKTLGSKVPIMGVCLGHQAICVAYGATVSYAKQLMHGKQSDAEINTKCRIFSLLPPIIPVARYHSLAAIESTMPDCLDIIARTNDGEIMAVKHKQYDVYGLQFHPESIMTPDGYTIIKNFLNIKKER